MRFIATTCNMPKSIDYFFTFLYIVRYKIRTAIALKYDPVITRQFGGFRLKMFLSHHFVFMYRVFPLFERNLEMLSQLLVKKYKKLYSIDIGANVGDTLIYMNGANSEDVHVMCIEGMDYYYELLQENAKQFKNITCVKALIGEKDANETLMVTRGHGSTLMARSEKGNTEVKFRKLSTILNEHTDFQQSKLIKIDTDGFDTLIIRSSADMLEKYKPIIFFEFDNTILPDNDKDYQNIFDLLCSIGYEEFIVYNYVGEVLFSFNKETLNAVKDIVFHLSFTYPRIRYYDIAAFPASEKDIAATIIDHNRKNPPKKYTNFEMINFIR